MHISCQKECVSPRGSGVCFLKRVVGPCKGNYMEWFYDAPSRSCKQFAYGGCLGNGNRFATKEDCQDVCSPDNKIPVCNKPKAEGACTGDFKRWFFNSKSGVCEEFSYSGCLGNNNRFMSKDLCENACKHSAKEIKTEEVCGLMLEDGNCTNLENNNIVPKWGYNPLLRRCVPFYLSGCGEPNINNFRTLQDCEEMCPTTFSPVISLPQGQEYLFERGRPDAVIPVSIKANPPAAVKWSLNSAEIGGIGGTAGFGAKSSNFMILPDFSLQINSVRDYDAGIYTVTADNGIGSPTSETVRVVVFPVFPTLSLDIDKTIYVPGSDVSFVCKIRGYPLPSAVWSKKEHRQPDSILQNDNDHIIIETFYDSTLEMVSKLTIRSVTDADTATYSCSVQTDFSPLVKKSVSISVQYGPGERCIDRVTFSKYCPIVVKSRKCQNSYYGKYCCRSCAAAGYLSTTP
ncbi:papilin [Eurytemora carolleeae]|uniref:papilin n=1 Tax=Eurytemora carolleeae TaxID=1294199 RepID=UPI000C76349C|nr:papilin [Eurytemora carolleeae]|eukprot:XP_023333697.1 papilin-like [Eurytemora affinis]